ncbi:hypothetical protein QFZ76_009482 [Streptomyces sp. V4I2]|nr:hypothetical protein [Streptomyces sp. V4I2]
MGSESLRNEAVERVPAEGGLSLGGPAYGVREFGRWGVLEFGLRKGGTSRAHHLPAEPGGGGT